MAHSCCVILDSPYPPPLFWLIFLGFLFLLFIFPLFWFPDVYLSNPLLVLLLSMYLSSSCFYSSSSSALCVKHQQMLWAWGRVENCDQQPEVPGSPGWEGRCAAAAPGTPSTPPPEQTGITSVLMFHNPCLSPKCQWLSQLRVMSFAKNASLIFWFSAFLLV